MRDNNRTEKPQRSKATIVWFTKICYQILFSYRSGYRLCASSG